MKKASSLLILLFLVQICKSQVSTGFNGYTGPGTEPVGWTITNGGSSNTYTTLSSVGLSAPSVRLDNSAESITSPSFSGGTTLQFWGGGQSVSGASALLVEEFVGGAWVTLINLTVAAGTLTNTNATYGPYLLNTMASNIRLTYNKGGGNMAIDDVVINGGILPINITFFKGSLLNKKALLEWIVADEVEISKFIIEKSIDGLSFTDLNTTYANGNLNYSFVDENKFSDIALYRLKIIGNTTKYSSIVKLIFNPYLTKVNLYPSPAINTINIDIVMNKAQYASLNIYTLDGKLVYQNFEMLHEGFNNFNLNIEKLNKGNYVLRMIAGNDSYNKLFSK